MSGWVIIAVLMLIALAVWLSVRFAGHLAGLRRGQHRNRRPKNGGGGDGTPMDGMTLRIGQHGEPLDRPGPRPWASSMS